MLKRIGWFVLLWLGGVIGLAVIASLIRMAIM